MTSEDTPSLEEGYEFATINQPAKHVPAGAQVWIDGHWNSLFTMRADFELDESTVMRIPVNQELARIAAEEVTFREERDKALGENGRMREALEAIDVPLVHGSACTPLECLCWIGLRKQALAAPGVEVSRWQPIDVAPKVQGKRILVLKDCGEGTLSSMSIAYWMDHDGWVCDGNGKKLSHYGYRATQWMPLPEMPESKHPATQEVRA